MGAIRVLLSFAADLGGYVRRGYIRGGYTRDFTVGTVAEFYIALFLDINECELSGQGGCQQECLNTHGTYRCQCRSGYRLASDGRSCDALPSGCAIGNGGCQHYCRDSQAGTPLCYCRDGFKLDKTDGKTCTGDL